MIVRFRAPDRDRVIGQRVQDIRRRQRRTQTSLGDAIGVSHSMMGKLERGERHWTLEAVAVAAEMLKVPSEYILGETLDVLDAVTPQEITSGIPAEASIRDDLLDLSMLDETDRTMIVAMHAVMARRTTRLAA